MSIGSKFDGYLIPVWDGREKLLKAMVLRPIANHVEMGITDLDALAKKLSGIPDYRIYLLKPMESRRYSDKIADALSHFCKASSPGRAISP